MGAKTWMLVYGKGNVSDALRAKPTLDREATRTLVTRLHPRHEVTALEDGTLLEDANPPEGRVYAGYEGSPRQDDPDLESIVLAGFAVQWPSRWRRWTSALLGTKS